MKYINLTPHEIKLNDGAIFPPSGKVARVESVIKPIEHNLSPYSAFTEVYGDVKNLPKPSPETYYIVSGVVFSNTNRLDVVKPATGHKDVCRNDSGHILSVPGFIYKQYLK